MGMHTVGGASGTQISPKEAGCGMAPPVATPPVVAPPTESPKGNPKVDQSDAGNRPVSFCRSACYGNIRVVCLSQELSFVSQLHDCSTDCAVCCCMVPLVDGQPVPTRLVSSAWLHVAAAPPRSFQCLTHARLAQYAAHLQVTNHWH